jgi:hypothetical protein
VESGALAVEWHLNSWSEFAPDLSVVLRNRTSRTRTILARFRFRKCDGRVVEAKSGAGESYGCLFDSRDQTVPLEPLGWNAMTFPLGAPTAERTGSDCTSELSIAPVDDIEGDETVVLRVPVARE